ncbi:MAG: MFS transporter, partial [Micromonosporaceae bacterium]
MSPTSARRRFALVSALTWLPTSLGVATMVLLMQVRGLSLAGVGIAFAAYGIAVAVLELPTGGLADVIGRRTVLAASAAVAIAAFAGLAFATSLWQFVAVSVLKGISRALSSGPAEAWYVDTHHAARTRAGDQTGSGDQAGSGERELRRGLATGHAAGSATLAVGTIVGGALPLLVPLPERGVIVPLSVPILLAVVAAVALLVVVVVGLPEPERAASPPLGEVLRGVPATIRRGIALGVRDRLLARVLLTAGALGFALNAIELLTPGRLAQLTGDPATASTAYALVAAVGFGAVAAGAAVSPLLARALGTRRDSSATGVARRTAA